MVYGAAGNKDFRPPVLTDMPHPSLLFPFLGWLCSVPLELLPLPSSGHRGRGVPGLGR